MRAIAEPTGMRTIAFLVACTATAAAETPGTEMSGFVTYGAGDLAGSVADLDGKPRAGVKVHVAAKGREIVVTTDAKGTFRTKLRGEGPTYVYVEEKVKITGQLASAVREGEYEAIAIRETLPPVVQPKPKIRLDTVLDYSAKAEDKNQWTRAWLLLDVGETGKVRRVKLLNAPGLDLDAIAIREAFAIPFEPARDRADNKVPALVLWTWEWPAHFWMMENQHDPHRLPPAAGKVACRGSGPGRALRDCSKPALAKAGTQPWIDKP